MSVSRVICLSLLALCFPWPSEGHGRLRVPPSRSSMWRDGYDTPRNYEDNQLFCGGFTHQWEQNDGKCGICGDPYDGERENEAGGIYANGIITETYEMGGVVRAQVELTAYHKGWFEFRICPNNDFSTPATLECLEILPLADNSGTRFYPDGNGFYDIELQLPVGMVCEQCVFQWRYHAGNNWGCDNGVCEVGLGPQEEFYGCSDVAIRSDIMDDGDNSLDSDSDEVDDTLDEENTTDDGVSDENTDSDDVSTESSDASTENGGNCRAVGAWTGDAGMDTWCENNCAVGYCPNSHCLCTQDAADSDEHDVIDVSSENTPSDCTHYKAIGDYSNSNFMNFYCQSSCTSGMCPTDYCTCVDQTEPAILRSCRTIPGLQDVPNLAELCTAMCNDSFCPRECICD